MRPRDFAIFAGVGFAVLLVLAASLVYTEQSSFCPTCHEMRPYYDAWASGSHANAAGCIDCHVDPGVIAHLAHKPVALREVWNHFFATNRFPTYAVELPNPRCQNATCHASIPDAKEGVVFSHAKHAAAALCKDCHRQAGHVVTPEALDAAGVLDPSARAPVPGGRTPSAVPGHDEVRCQECHDQAGMECSACHQAPHEDRGACSKCHLPGGSFVFSHSPTLECASCHEPPSKHFGPGCASCHDPDVAFDKTVFRHSGDTGEHSYRSFACVKCHPGNDYSTSYCSCHKGNPPIDD